MACAAGHLLKLASRTYNKGEGKFLDSFSITFISLRQAELFSQKQGKLELKVLCSMYCKIRGCIPQRVFLPNCDGLNSRGERPS